MDLHYIRYFKTVRNTCMYVFKFKIEYRIMKIPSRQKYLEFKNELGRYAFNLLFSALHMYVCMYVVCMYSM